MMSPGAATAASVSERLLNWDERQASSTVHLLIDGNAAIEFKPRARRPERADRQTGIEAQRQGERKIHKGIRSDSHAAHTDKDRQRQEHIFAYIHTFIHCTHTYTCVHIHNRERQRETDRQTNK